MIISCTYNACIPRTSARRNNFMLIVLVSLTSRSREYDELRTRHNVQRPDIRVPTYNVLIKTVGFVLRNIYLRVHFRTNEHRRNEKLDV